MGAQVLIRETWYKGALLFIVALPHALMLRRPTVDPLPVRVVPPSEPSTPRGTIRTPMPTATPVPTLKTCPMCAEQVQAAARICRFCRHEFPEPAPIAAPSAPDPSRPVPFGMKACPSCKEYNWHDANVCKNCGTTFAMATGLAATKACPACGDENFANADKCAHCKKYFPRVQ